MLNELPTPSQPQVRPALLAQSGNAKVCRTDIAMVALCILVGVFLSILPHLLIWHRIGEPVFLQDHDNLDQHVVIGAQAYNGHLTHITDPFDDQSSMYFSALEFLPGVWIAKLFGLGPLGVNLVWRIFAGITIPLGFYLVIRTYVRNPYLVMGFVLLIIGDSGLMFCRPLLSNLALAIDVATGHATEELHGYPALTTQWRLITPGMSLGYLLLFVWGLGIALRTKSWRWTALAGLLFGLLFWLYLYYWMSICLALPMAFILDKAGRKTYFHVGWIGGLIGMPSVLIGWALKNGTSKDYLNRLDLFLPIARFAELGVPKVSILAAIVTGIWIFWKRRDLIYIWTIALAALLLLNHQIVTKMQLQNHHFKFVSGPILLTTLYILLGGIALPRAWLKWAALVFAIVCILHTSAAVYLRTADATQNEVTKQIMLEYEHYRDQRLRTPTTPLSPHAIIAGDMSFVPLSMAMEQQLALYNYVVTVSPHVTNEDLDKRIALNAYLRGLNFAAFKAEAPGTAEAGPFGIWVRNKQLLNARVQNLLKLYNQIYANPLSWIAEYHVTYVVLPADQPTPDYLTQQGWQRMQAGPFWQIWRRPAATDKLARTS